MGTTKIWLSIALLGLLLLPAPARAIDHRGEGRKTKARDLAVEPRRFELANGLTVLLAPDPTVSSVLVWITYRAGTVYEPAGRSGMAHLVEHVMASGPTPDTDYAAMLERRRARYFNAVTTAEIMQFETVVPAEELPLALWTVADRMGSLPPLIDDKLVEYNRRVVIQERAIRDVDAPYGLVREVLYDKLFAAPHPMHGAVIGTVAELKQVTGEDVRSFIGRLLVPANAIVTVVGRFDPEKTRALVEESLGRLPAGERAKMPTFKPLSLSRVAMTSERISREPAVVLAWRVPVAHDQAAVLDLGAQLLSFLTDGVGGMRLSAGLHENESESLFMLNLTVPYDETIESVQSDAEGFLRMLTRRQMPLDLLMAANIALDREALFELDTLEGRAGRLSSLERLVGARANVAKDCEAHWLLDPAEVRELAEGWLTTPRVVLHARPDHPREARKVHDL
ncbi:MAG TPA: pitrilysin family protein [Myxococcales bacterium]|nr:pitrilysin family protein [Myxococcales bacterium]